MSGARPSRGTNSETMLDRQGQIDDVPFYGRKLRSRVHPHTLGADLNYAIGQGAMKMGCRDFSSKPVAAHTIFLWPNDDILRPDNHENRVTNAGIGWDAAGK